MVAKMVPKQKSKAKNSSKLKEKCATPAAATKPKQQLKHKLWSVSTGVENKPSFNKVYRALKLAVKEGILDLTPDGGYRLVDEKQRSRNVGQTPLPLLKKLKSKRSCPEVLRKRSYSVRRHHGCCRHHSRRHHDYSRTDPTLYSAYSTRSRRGRNNRYYYRYDDRSDMYSDY